MSKKLFLTLVLILGISSLSFGKSYLCIGEKSINIYPNTTTYSSIDKVITWKHLSENGGKFMIKTDGENEKIKWVKRFRAKIYVCKSGDTHISEYSPYASPKSGFMENIVKGESININQYLSCRLPYNSLIGGYTVVEFNLDLKKMTFHYYRNSHKTNTETEKGKCEEI